MMQRRVCLFVVIATLCAAAYFTVSANTQQSAPAAAQKEKTAAEAFKNIQVLKDIPASKLTVTMNFIAASLGVRCDFCHVTPFDKDDKREKQTARKMIQMVQAINKDNFGGRTEVSCASCHHGQEEPTSFPPLEGFVMPKPDKDQGTLPAVDELIHKYEAALGGSEAIKKITSREATFTIENASIGKVEGQLDQKAPGKIHQSITLKQGVLKRAYDGSTGWMQPPAPGSQIRSFEGDELEGFKANFELFRGLSLTDPSLKARVFGKGKLGDTNVFAIGWRSPEGNQNIYFFDASTWLLIKILGGVQTPLGPLVHTLDLSDYREVDGVKVPFTIKETVPGSVNLFHYTDIKHNVQVDDSVFARPPASAESTKGSGK